MKASITKRIGGYLIDVILIFLVLTLISPIIPTFGDTTKLEEESMEISKKFLNQEITQEEFIEKANDINYDISKASYLTSIVSICLYLGYFIVMPLFTNGQTLGKKLMKLKIKKIDDTALTTNNLLIRTAILYGVLNSIINLILLLVTSKNVYLNVSGYVNTVFSLVIIITFFMMIFRKDGRGIPDLLAKTVVVTDEEKELQ